MKRFVRSVSAVFLLVIALGAVFSPWITPYEFDEQNIETRLESPSRAHWMGTDTLGRDLFSRIVHGARASLTVGLVTAFFALVVGTLLGVIAGFAGGWVDSLLLRAADLFYTIPSTLVAILLILAVGKGLGGILIAIALTTWTLQARIARNLVVQLKPQPFVEAARAMGLKPSQVLFRHILPNLAGPTIVTLSFQIPNNIMAESFLSFIGLGLQPPQTSWGTLASEGFRAMQSYPHLILFPGLILFFSMLALGEMGDWLRERLDPGRVGYSSLG